MAALVASPSTIARPVWPSRSPTGKPSLQADAARTGDLQQRLAERGEVGLVQAAAVDAAGAAGDDRDARGDPQHDRVERLARLFGVLLGVVEQRERADVARTEAVVVKEHGRRDQRAGQAAATGLVGAGDEAHAERAVVLEELAASAALPFFCAAWPSWARRRELAPRRRGQIRGLGGSTTTTSGTAAASSSASVRLVGSAEMALEEADALGRPVGGEGATDDPLARDRAPEPAVVGLATVVAHHEPMVGGNLDRPREVAAGSALARPREAVGLALAVDEGVAALDVQRVARAGDDALDEVDLGLGRRGARRRPGQASCPGRRRCCCRSPRADGRRRPRRPRAR